MNYIYNWLNNKGVLKKEVIDVYFYDGKKLKGVFKKIDFDDNFKFLSIFLKDLDLSGNNKMDFYRDHFEFGRFLDDIMDNINSK